MRHGTKKKAMEQFGRQAEAYSKGNTFVDGAHLSEIVKRSGAVKQHKVLDVATGTGSFALEFAKVSDMVIGADITRNMLLHATGMLRRSGNADVGFLLSDVESLPFGDKSFDIVSCRSAFHHFPDAEKALLEMKRVCKTRGKIVLVDFFSSEDRDKNLFHNRIEKLRDPSHVRIYALNEVRRMFGSIGAAIVDIQHRDIPQDFEEWMRRAGTDRAKIDVIDGLMKQSMEEDRTGLSVRIEDGRLGFIYKTVILVAEVMR